MLCIKNGRIHDAVHREPYTADILIENGKLLQIGTDLHAEQTIDAAGLEIYPGFVDAHSHIGLDGYVSRAWISTSATTSAARSCAPSTA